MNELLRFLLKLQGKIHPKCRISISVEQFDVIVFRFDWPNDFHAQYSLPAWQAEKFDLLGLEDYLAERMNAEYRKLEVGEV